MSQSQSMFELMVELPRRIPEPYFGGRKKFFLWAWNDLKNFGLVGVHEGTVLSNGITTTKDDLDEAIPRGRDWVGDSEFLKSTLYFDSYKGACLAKKKVEEIFPSLKSPFVNKVVEQDWNKVWKKNFTGILVPPNWAVLPPWMPAKKWSSEKIIRVNPGAGFGTGTHETTQLCLEILGNLKKTGLSGKKLLDFGCGSGILSIAAALLGASCDGVEIDDLAIDNAKENSKLSGVADRISFSKKIPDRTYPLVVANILKETLLRFESILVASLDSRQSTLILSGLIEEDVQPVRLAYEKALGGCGFNFTFKEFSKNEWFALVFHCK